MNTFLELLESWLPHLLAASLSAAGIAVAVLGIHVVLRGRLSVRCSHALWCLVFVRLLLPALPEAPKFLSPVKPMPAQVKGFLDDRNSPVPAIRSPAPLTLSSPALSSPAQPSERPAAPPIFQPTSRPWTVTRWLAVGWLSGVMLCMGTMFTGFTWLRRQWHRDALPPSARLLELMNRVCREIHCRRSPGIIVSAAVRCPLVAGLVRPRLYLPWHVATQFSDEALRFVLLHELGHLRRGDLWINLISSVLQALHWFNPLVWFAARRLRAAVELSCDAWVLRKLRPDDARSYGETLLHLLETQSVTRAWPGTAAMAESRRDLHRRIQGISRWGHASRRHAWLSAAVLVLAAFAGLTVPGQTTTPSAAEHETGDSKTAPHAPAVPMVVPKPKSSPPVVRSAHSREPDISSFHPGKFKRSPPSFAGDLKPEPVEADELAGVVLDSNGKPLAGANVLSYALDQWLKTDDQGRFRYRITSAKGKSTTDFVRIQADGFGPLTLIEQTTGVYGFVLLKKNTWVAGDVRDAAGQPVKGAAIRLEQSRKGGRVAGNPGRFAMPYREARTDEQGHYKLFLEPDNYSVSMFCRELGKYVNPPLSVFEGEEVTLNFPADPDVIFEARFVDNQTGKPVPEAELTLHFWEIQQSWKADAKGTLILKGLMPGTVEFQPRHPDYGRWWAEDADDPPQKTGREKGEWLVASAIAASDPRQKWGQENKRTHWQYNFDQLTFTMGRHTKPVTIHMEKGVTIRGRVLDPEGRPVPQATVDPAHTGTGNSLTGDTRFSVMTDAEGRYELHLPASNAAAYNMMAHDGKYREWRNWANGVLPPMQTKPGDLVENADIHLTRPGIVRGLVVDGNGQPVPHQRVFMEPFERWENRYYNPETFTDENGRFELKHVRPAKQYVLACNTSPDPENNYKGSREIIEVQAGKATEVRVLVGR